MKEKKNSKRGIKIVEKKKMGAKKRRYKKRNPDINRKKINICFIALELAVIKGREQIRRL